MLGTPPAFVLSQDQTLHKTIMKNLDRLLVNVFVVNQLVLINKRPYETKVSDVYLFNVLPKEAPHI